VIEQVIERWHRVVTGELYGLLADDVVFYRRSPTRRSAVELSGTMYVRAVVEALLCQVRTYS
jgi:hypothetical protein